MKWIFFILLLINTGLFVWIYPQNQPPEPAITSSPVAKSLILLSELSQSSAEKQKFESAMEAELDQGMREINDGKSVGIDIEAADTKPSLDGSDDTLKDAAVVLSEPLTGKLVNDEADQQDEKLVQSNTVSSSSQEKVTEIISQPEPDVYCSRIGPLDKREKADKLSLRLRGLSLQPELHSEMTKAQEGYWVLVPPQENRALAIGIVKRLRKAGVSDYWRFTSGSLAHAISLGLFRNVSRAEIRRKAIAEKGFDAEVRPRYRQKTSYWLGFTYSSDSPITEQSWKEIVELHPGIEQHSVDCQESMTRY